MRRLVIFLGIFIWVLITNCGKEETLFPRVAKDSPQYNFFKELAETVPLVDPEKDILLLETTEFKVTTGTILIPLYDEIYTATGGNVDKFKNESASRIKEFVKMGAQQLAEKKLLILAAKKDGYKADKDSINAILEQEYEKADGKENFLKGLEERHLTLDLIRREIEEKLILDRYIDEHIFADIQVSESEIMAVYSQDKVATIRHLLLITKDKSASEKAAILQKMESLLKQLKAGADFAKLAQLHSEDYGSNKRGGLMKNVNRGDLFQEIDEVVFSLPVGEISDIIETDLGYHLIKVEDRQQDPREYEEAKPKIIEQLTKPAKEKALQDKIDELKQEYQLKIVAIPS